MLSRFDDYPIHQTPDPIAVPASSDKDVYERYWFNGYSADGSLYFGVGAAYYPHLGIRDASISVLVDGVQHSFHVSGRASGDPSELRVGPFRIEIVEPMRVCRVVLEPNDTGAAAELTFEGRTGNVEEPRHQLGGGLRRTMDTTRFTQFGRWRGWVQVGPDRIELDSDATLGTKDRSWGRRSLAGGDPRGAPRTELPSLFFLWAPLHLGDVCAHYQLFEAPDGRPLFSVGALLPTYPSADEVPGVEDPAVRHMRHNEHRLTFRPGSRFVTSASLGFTAVDDGGHHEIELEPMATFRMKGLGYLHPQWGHGMWKGELAMDVERWAEGDLDPTSVPDQHVQHVVRARMGDDEGIGALEQLLLGHHRPYGLSGFVDPPS